MSEYIISVMAASAIVALGGLASYGGNTERISRAAMAVVLLYTVTLPIFSVTGNISDLISADFFEGLRVEYDQSDTLFYENTAQAFCEGVGRFVCDGCDLDSADVSVRVTGLDLESMRAEKITVTLCGRAVSADARLIAEAVESAGLGECEVMIDRAKQNN